MAARSISSAPDLFRSTEKVILKPGSAAILLSSVDPLVYFSLGPRYAGPMCSDRVWKIAQLTQAPYRGFAQANLFNNVGYSKESIAHLNSPDSQFCLPS
jgi:hypothetical protein